MARRVSTAELSSKLDAHIQATNDHRAEVKEQMKQLLTYLQDNGKPGLITRVDRLEQVESKRAWHIRTVWAAMVAGFITFIAKG
jgi:ferritin-like metal-binding protein YciE